MRGSAVKNSDLIILCDLGGVLIDLNWVSHARALFGDEVSPEALKGRWLSLASVREFEAGKIDFSDFYRQFCSETGSNIAVDDFKCEFTGILGPDKPGCREVLERLAQRGRLVMLSNTNALHVEALKQTSQVFSPFDDLLFSYELGLVKPDAHIFSAVCDRIGCRASDVLFFDDSELNITAAKACGLNAWRVDTPQEIEKIVNAWPKTAVL